KFLEGYQGYLQADAYSVYDAFFKPARGLTEVGCWMHARRYFFNALESDQQRMGPALHLIARLYGVEDRAKSLTAEERLALRQRQWRQGCGCFAKLHRDVQAECGRAVCLVPRRAHASRHASDQPDRRVAPTQLENPRRCRPGLISSKMRGSGCEHMVVHQTL